MSRIDPGTATKLLDLMYECRNTALDQRSALGGDDEVWEAARDAHAAALAAFTDLVRSLEVAS